MSIPNWQICHSRQWEENSADKLVWNNEYANIRRSKFMYINIKELSMK